MRRLAPTVLIVCMAGGVDARRGRAAGGVAVEPSRRRHLEFHRRGSGAVRHHRARRRQDRAAAGLRSRGHGDRTARDLAHAAQGARARHLGQCRLARIRARAVLSRDPEQPPGHRDRPSGRAAAVADRARQLPAAAADRPRRRRHRARRSVPRRLRAAGNAARPVPRVRHRGDLPDADRVPRRDPGAGQRADRQLCDRRQVVRRWRHDRAHHIRRWK